MRVIVSGASGLIGSALCSTLVAGGHDVVKLVRRTAGANEIHWDPANGVLAADALDGADAVVHLAGAGIGDKRWTKEYRQLILDSRVKSTTLLAETIAPSSNRPTTFLSGSAIGIYGASDGRHLDESSPAGTGFLADVCQQWEAAAERTFVESVAQSGRGAPCRPASTCEPGVGSTIDGSLRRCHILVSKGKA